LSRRRNRNKQITLNRAGGYPLGNGLMYVPAGQQQGLLGQTFYGTSTKNIPVGQSALFSPGIPLYPQPNVNPNGYPVQFRFPVAVNTFPVDRTSNDPDIPSFAQLRSLAKLYNGITLCERAWMDMVPRMKVKVHLKQSYVDSGADPKDYQADITYFMTWLESPDKMHDLHSWIRMALREQTQIDELYIYKRKKRGGGIHSLEIVSGDQMKPLLNDWGMIPQPPAKAFQQYPWGLPGAWFGTDEMFHYQESPAADNPYGQSRVERIIMLVNQALRKQKKDLSHFTEGNIPQGIMRVPENATWTPDQIDAFEQEWNALLGGNSQQQVRVRFTQPGMEYQSFEQYQLDPTFDKFIINIAVGAYGMSMQDLGFTEDIHKTSSESQEGMTYRRTVEPLAVIYAGFLTNVINNDFPEELNGEMFDVSFYGYEEEDDIVDLTDAYTKLTSAGILGITNASKLLRLPDDPNAPYIGRVFLGKDGPMFLDDMASDKMRSAAVQSQLAGLQSQQMQSQQAANQNQKGEQQNNQQLQPPEEDLFRSISSVDQVIKENNLADVQPPPYSDEYKNEANKPAKKSTHTHDEEGNEVPVEDNDKQVKQQPKEEETPQEENEDDQQEDEEEIHFEDEEDQRRENEITMLLKADQDEPFTLLERHTPFGYSHDQKTHGDWEHPLYGANNDANPKAKSIMHSQSKVQNAKSQILSATNQQQQSSAQQNLKQAEADLRLTKAGASVNPAVSSSPKVVSADKNVAKSQVNLLHNQSKLASAQVNGQVMPIKAAAKADMMKAHLVKSAAMANAKAQRMQTKIQHQAQLAAAKAAKSTSKSTKGQLIKALSTHKSQHQSAKALSKITTTIGSKAQLYNALSGRKISSTWTKNDSSEAYMISQDLRGLLEIVHTNQDENDAQSLLNSMKSTIDDLKNQPGISQVRKDVLTKLSDRLQQNLALQRMVEEWVNVYLPIEDEVEDASDDYRKWRQRAIEDVKEGKVVRTFSSTLIPENIYEYIRKELEEVQTIEDVKRVFKTTQRLEELQII